MVKYKSKLSAAAVFLVMCFTLVMSGYDSMTGVGATGGTDYVKYTYATGTQETYNLPEIPVDQNITAMTARAMSDYVDPRPNADLDTAVVALHYYGYYLYSGTGFIIGDHEIMTAAHLVYSKDAENGKYFGYSIQVTIPDSNPYTSQSTELEVVSVHVPQNYIDHENGLLPSNNTPDYDYAILTVSEDLSQYGRYILGMGTDSLKNKDVPIHCLGYLGRDLKISNLNNRQYEANDLMYYFIDLYSYKNSSGGPIYVESVFGVEDTSNEEYNIKKYRTAISIVSGGYGIYDDTTGTRIRPEIMQFAYSNNYL